MIEVLKTCSENMDKHGSGFINYVILWSKLHLVTATEKKKKSYYLFFNIDFILYFP